jgi:pyruvate kinase
LLNKCNFVGKLVVVTCVGDLMIEIPCPTYIEVADVANVIIDGTDGVLLGAKTLKGLYPIEPSQCLQV